MAISEATALPDQERERRVQSEPAQRILAALSRCVGELGAAGATFDRITRDAGVARGSVFYYFGSKERLLVELIRREAELRTKGLRETLATASTLDEVVGVLGAQLRRFIEANGAQVLLFEMASSAPRNPELRLALGQLYAGWRETLGDLLRQKTDEGIVDAGPDPETTACTLTALGEGIALQAIAEPDRDRAPLLDKVAGAARSLLGG